MRSYPNLKKMLWVLVLSGAFMHGIGGCVVEIPESVLNGKWLLTTDDASTLPNPTYLSFNSTGAITEIQFVIGLATFTFDPDNGLTGNAVVNGQNVTISETFGLNTLTFEGTFNSGFTQAKGNITTVITLGDLNITLASVPATMTKQ